ncbi:MAG: hypothetical protein KA449_02215 [Pelolinea sp.]|nr:hypothetical protein [Pelolinea sp.]
MSKPPKAMLLPSTSFGRLRMQAQVGGSELLNLAAELVEATQSYAASFDIFRQAQGTLD